MSRVFDVFVVCLCLIPAALMGLSAGCAVFVLSGHPVFFRQIRVGRGGRRFTILKFRTMRPSRQADHGFQAGRPHRVTQIGKLLRATKVDELPQLVNVLTGDMAIVGPRPEVPSWVDREPVLFERLLTTRPGLTDPASLVFRHEEALLAEFDDPEAAYGTLVLPAKVQLSAKYLQSRTVWSDLRVIWSTLRAIVGLPHHWSGFDARALLQAERNRRNEASR